MPVSEKIGGLPLLSWIFDYGPWWAASIMFVADFGIIWLLMIAEGLSPHGVMPWNRHHYKTFIWNDTIWIPLYMAMVVIVLQGAPKLSSFYTERWVHVAVLVLGFVMSLGLEWQAVKNGQYTMSQELSPSKVWHTVIYGIVFYWLVATIVPVAIIVITKGMWFKGTIIVVAMAGFFYESYRDAVLPFPYNAHLAGNYWPWDWHPRR